MKFGNDGVGSREKTDISQAVKDSKGGLLPTSFRKLCENTDRSTRILPENLSLFAIASLSYPIKSPEKYFEAENMPKAVAVRSKKGSNPMYRK